MKRDQAEPAIVQVLEKAGWWVTPIFIRNGPDLIACRGGHVVFIECKTGKAGLTEGQKAFHAQWKGPAIRILRSQDEAIEFVQEHV